MKAVYPPLATVFNNYKLQGKYIFDIAYELATNKSIDNIEELKYKKILKYHIKRLLQIMLMSLFLMIIFMINVFLHYKFNLTYIVKNMN